MADKLYNCSMLLNYQPIAVMEVTQQQFPDVSDTAIFSYFHPIIYQPMYSDTFCSLFFQKSDFLPDDLIQAWNAVVQRIEQGYNDLEPELDHDLDLRDQVKVLTLDPDLQQIGKDHSRFIESIESIDLRLKQLIYDNPTYSDRANKQWWQLIILKKGRIKYYEDIWKLYQIQIELAS